MLNDYVGNFSAFRIGPMNTDIKFRKPAVRRKHVRPTESSRPEEVKLLDLNTIVTFSQELRILIECSGYLLNPFKITGFSRMTLLLLLSEVRFVY